MSDAFAFGPFRLHASTRILLKDGVDVALGSRAFDILAALLEGNGKVLTHRELMAIAWPELVVEDSNVRVQVANIRRALGCGRDGARYIASVAGRGYCFVAAIERLDPLGRAPEADLAAGEAQPSRAAQGAVPLSVFPAPLKDAVGREECVAELSSTVLGRRLVTVVGAAGAGKTTLAVLVAHAVVDAFEGAMHFVDLSAVDSPEMVAEALAGAVGYTAPGAELFPGLLDVLGTRRTLIVLDNCEHVIAAVATLCLRILDGTRTVSFLTTSREALRVNDEFIHLLRPLASPPNTGRLTAQQALLWPAIQLFMERAREGGARDVLSDDDAPTVAALCRRLDGNPHAIGLVASRVGAYGVQGVADLLGNQFALHWQGRRDACPRQQTVETMIDWSHNLLVERDRQVLYRLSVFSGVFSLDTAVAVVAEERLDAFEVGEAIGDLVDKSLVTIGLENGETRFKLLETTRAYAASRLARLPCRDEIGRRHALCYAEQLHRYAEARSTAATDALPHLPDVGNVRAAMEWAFTEGRDLALAVRISDMAAPLFLELGLLRESKRCCERALRSLPDALSANRVELGLLESLAITCYAVGDYDGEMEQVVQRGLELSRQTGDLRSMFRFLAGLHLVMMANGRFPESLTVSERYAQAALDQGGAHEAVVARWLEGASRHFSGSQREADERFSVSQDMAAGLVPGPLHYFEAKEQVVASLGMARVKWMRGLPLQALQLATSAIEESRRHPDSFYLCATLCFPILLGNDLPDQAEGLIQELESVANDYKVSVRRQVIHFLDGLLLLHQHCYPEAAEHLRQCLAMLPPPKMSVVRTDALQALAEAQHACGDDRSALASIDEAIELVERTGGAFNLPDLMRTRADVLQSLVPEAEVETLLRQARDCARRQFALGWELKVVLRLARVLASRGRNREASEMLLEVRSRFSEGFDTRDLRALALALQAL